MMNINSIALRFLLPVSPALLLMMVALGSGCSEKPAPERAVPQAKKTEKGMQKGMQKSTSPYISCQVIEKDSRSQMGKSLDRKELYLRCSIKDYFIKFCESLVSKEDVLPYLNRGITVKMKVQMGEWDSCPGEKHIGQSRIGDYAVIQKVVTK